MFPGLLGRQWVFHRLSTPLDILLIREPLRDCRHTMCGRSKSLGRSQVFCYAWGSSSVFRQTLGNQLQEILYYVYCAFFRKSIDRPKIHKIIDMYDLYFRPLRMFFNELPLIFIYNYQYLLYIIYVYIVYCIYLCFIYLLFNIYNY